MSTRTAKRLARALVTATVVIHGAWFWLLVLNAQSGLAGQAFSYAGSIATAAPAIAFVVVGYLIGTRKPANPIGWLLLATGPLFSLPMLAQQYAAYDLLAGKAALPGAHAVAISLNGMWIPGLFVLLLVAFVFPTGYLPTRRWRPVIWMAAISLSLLFVIAHVGKLDPPFSEIRNPFELDLEGSVAARAGLGIVFAGLLSSAIAACASVVVRFRRSTGDEREQLKWFIFAAAVLPVSLIIHLTAETVAPSALRVIEPGFSLAVSFLPIAIGIAVLKYRLYEIDRIISRALVYGGLSVVLAAVYVTLVLAGQALFSSFAGGSNLAIAASTLLVAALFLPVRARIQRFVDRRFYRRRYDAERTLQAFGSRLREQIELDALSADLLGAVGETMQPAFTSLWLNDSPRTARPVTIP